MYGGRRRRAAGCRRLGVGGGEEVRRAGDRGEGPCIGYITWVHAFFLIVSGVYLEGAMGKARSKGTVYIRHQSKTKAREQSGAV